MRSFVYESRVIENERQVKLERQAKQVCSALRVAAKALAAFFFFIVLNLLLNSHMQYTNMFSVNTWHFIEEAARVLFVDNASVTEALLYEDFICFVLALSFICISEFSLVVKALDNGKDNKEKCNYTKREDKPQTVSNCGLVAYKNKVCFLS